MDKFLREKWGLKTNVWHTDIMKDLHIRELIRKQVYMPQNLVTKKSTLTLVISGAIVPEQSSSLSSDEARPWRLQT